MKVRSRVLTGLLIVAGVIGLGSTILAQRFVQSIGQGTPLLDPSQVSQFRPHLEALSDSPHSSESVYQRVNPAVVTIYGVNNLGSGMILKANGLVLTNRHVVQNSGQVSIKTADGKTYDGDVIDLDLRYDLALIQLRNVAIDLPIVSLAGQVDSSVGETVYAIGSPNGKAGTLTTGTFLRVTEQGSLQTSAGLLRPGNSGGPLLNTHGDVIGVNKGLLNDQSGLATSVVAVRQLLQRRDRLP